jgi:hypothetical protein
MDLLEAAALLSLAASIEETAALVAPYRLLGFLELTLADPQVKMPSKESSRGQ